MFAWLKKIIVVAILITGIAYVSDVRAETIRIKPSQDTYIDINMSKVNFGQKEVMEVSGYNPKTSLVKFVIPEELKGRKIKKAKISLVVVYTQNYGKDSVKNSLVEILQPWEENKATWENRPSMAEEDIAVFSVDQSDVDEIIEVSSYALTRLVQAWVDGSVENNGVAIKETKRWTLYKVAYTTRENHFPPVLEIEYGNKK